MDAAGLMERDEERTLKRWRTNVLTGETPAEVQSRLAQAYHAFAAGAAA